MVGSLAINTQGDTSPGRSGCLSRKSITAASGAAPSCWLIEMAPLYDLLATVAYPELSPKLAMKIAGRATLDALKARDWGRFADESGLSQPFVKRRAKALADRVLQATAPVETGFDLNEGALKTMREYANLTAERAAQLSRITS